MHSSHTLKQAICQNWGGQMIFQLKTLAEQTALIFNHTRHAKKEGCSLTLRQCGVVWCVAGSAGELARERARVWCCFRRCEARHEAPHPFSFGLVIQPINHSTSSHEPLTLSRGVSVSLSVACVCVCLCVCVCVCVCVCMCVCVCVCECVCVCVCVCV
jgi:hypothetical protein